MEYYKKAKAFIFPGMEDFGIAPVEAQAHFTPVIAFGKGGALETVVSDKTGVFFQNKPWNLCKLQLIDPIEFPGKLPSFRRM
ncbi:glycosyltransferase, group 1 domain protein [Leptospira interrogans serovar Bataviae str. HAI135]|nr:glycosyltransferase, group 1 domain protein [Leptospira interrogans serovar Bataviae str. HAI135]